MQMFGSPKGQVCAHFKLSLIMAEIPKGHICAQFKLRVIMAKIPFVREPLFTSNLCYVDDFGFLETCHTQVSPQYILERKNCFFKHSASALILHIYIFLFQG